MMLYNRHVNCSNVLIDQDVSVAGSMSCLQKSSPFTQIEDINLSNLLHPMLERDYDRFNNIVFDPFNQNSGMSDLGFHQYQVIKIDNI